MSRFNYGETGTPTGGYTFDSGETSINTTTTGFIFSTPDIGLALPSTTVTTTASSSTMLFTSVSNAFTSTAASELSSTTSTTSTTTVTTNTTTTITSGFNLNLRPLTSPGINNTDPVSVSSVPLTSTVNSIVTPVMTYGQLDGLINKWSLELEDQEKYFLRQATQVNAWDCTLMENAEEISILHGEVEKVKLDQKRLEQELDFILSQQRELEDLLTPLEQTLKDQSESVYLQHEDKEYERIYILAETIDANLKQMSQDLKDITDHLNTFGSPVATIDQLQQICKILNAHLDSLQWINRNSGMMQQKVEEITKIFEDFKSMEQELNMKIAFD